MRSVKHGRRKARRRINYSRNSITAKKKAVKKRKAMEGMACKEMRAAWNKNATVKQNMRAMGLAYDSNKLLPLRANISNECHNGCEEMDDPRLYGSVKSQMPKTKSVNSGSKTMKVIAALEKEVEEEESKQKKGRRYRLITRDIEFCVYMIEKYGEDYEKMSRDGKNIYQDTPKQIQRKIRIFKESPEYSVYLKLMSEMAQL